MRTHLHHQLGGLEEPYGAFALTRYERPPPPRPPEHPTSGNQGNLSLQSQRPVFLLSYPRSAETLMEAHLQCLASTDLTLSYLPCFPTLIWRTELPRPGGARTGLSCIFSMRSGTAARSQHLLFNWQPASQRRGGKQIASLLKTQTRYWYNNSGQAAGSGAVSLSHTDKSAVHMQAGCVCWVAISPIHLAGGARWPLPRVPADRTLSLPPSEDAQLNNSFAFFLFFFWWGLAKETSKIARSIFVALSASDTPRQAVLPFHVTHRNSGV